MLCNVSFRYMFFYFINRISGFMILILWLSFDLSADESRTNSPFNNKEILLTDAAEKYSFIVSGHLHGASSNISGFPASSLLANLDTINQLKPSFFVSLGDLFLNADKRSIKNYEGSFFQKIDFPLFNAVGNHDISNEYKKRFGPTFFSFAIKSEVYIFLDTEINDGSLKSDQYDFLNNAIINASLNKNIKNIFVFSHRPVWAENNKQFKGLFADNTRTEIGMNNFESDIKPLFINISKFKNIYWMSGSFGNAPVSFFYAKDNDFNITYIQTAIRDVPRDAVLLVNINSGKVSFKGISLTGQKLKNIEEYNIDFWKSNTPV